ncbi:MAG: hypothetical protein IKL47_03460 [Clostridia bacterium]|nr:hypothetical protein [Clostridia bacterium]
MTGNNIKYLLGIDGGGTKTEFLLTDMNKKKIRQIYLGTSNPVNCGIENSESILRLGISEICEALNYSEISVFAGLAGGGSKDIKAEIHRFLGEFGFGSYANGSDTDSTLELALKGESGVAVIMGTGIVAFCQSDGERHRIGGWGYMIDKGGSGFHLGSDALDSAFGYLDGRGGSKLISELVENKLGKSLEDSLSEIYSGGPAFIASFAPIIFDAFEQGDGEAEKILDRNAREASKIITTAQSFLKNNEKTVICGGLSRQKNILKPFLLKYTEDDYPLIFSDEPTVSGAVSLAKSNISGGEINA